MTLNTQEDKLSDKKPIFKKEKTPIYLLIVLSAILAVITLNLKERYDKQNKEIGILAKKIEVISSARATLQQALKKSIGKKIEYRFSLQDEIKRREALDEQLKQLFSEKAASQSMLSDLESQNYALKDEVSQLEQEKGILNERLASFQKVQDRLQFKIKRLLTTPKIELGEVVVTASSLTGNVLKANRLYNFIIIDLGKNDGIESGMSLMAYRQDKLIGEIIIEKVYDELCVGKATFEWHGDELDVGDTIQGKEG